jgi:hypothetical protein
LLLALRTLRVPVRLQGSCCFFFPFQNLKDIVYLVEIPPRAFPWSNKERTETSWCSADEDAVVFHCRDSFEY